MNKLLSFVALTALLAGTAACSTEEAIAPADGNIVKVSASIGSKGAFGRSNPVGTVEEQGKFNVGDAILVNASATDGSYSDNVTYTFNGTDWVAQDGKLLLWKQNSLDFQAYYPAAFALANPAETFIENIPTDQSTLEKIAGADVMEGDNYGKAKADVVSFSMSRLASRMIVKIASFNNEFDAATATVSDVKLVLTPNGGGTAKEYLPYAQGTGAAGSTYTALLPNNYSGALAVSMTVGGKTLTAPLTLGDAGKSYTFNIIVGKNKLEVGSINVADWTTGSTITGDFGDTGIPVITNPYIIEYVSGKFQVPVASDGFIYPEDAETKIVLERVTYLSITNTTIKEVNELQYFPNMENLDVFRNKISYLDVTILPKLRFLSCNQNLLHSIDVTKNPELTNLDCSDNDITEIDLSQNPKLARLSCSSTKVSSLDLSANPLLEWIYISSLENLTALDISNCPKLTFLNCGYSRITSLDVTHNPELETLSCNSCNIKEIDISKCPKLTTFDISGQKDDAGNYLPTVTVKLTQAQKDANFIQPSFVTVNYVIVDASAPVRRK